jgi:hypothetical protein
MIAKEMDPFNSADPALKAGRAAEEQVAFYLRRAFGPNQHVLVFNSLRLEWDGDASQMDHLLLHRHGGVIIESKSVTDAVNINAHGEWSRRSGGRTRGMPSPILQAERQGQFLKRYLCHHDDQLRGKLLGLVQASFGCMDLKVLVAISDSGIVERARPDIAPEVHKADAIADRAKRILGNQQRASSLFNLRSDGGWWLNQEELDRVSNFLLQHHMPVRRRAPESPPGANGRSGERINESPNRYTTFGAPMQSPSAPSTQSPAEAPAASVSLSSHSERLGSHSENKSSGAVWSCRKCGSQTLKIVHGQYSYYFKCMACQGNTNLSLICPTCQGKEKPRKREREFFRECPVCGTSRLFFQNP